MSRSASDAPAPTLSIFDATMITVGIVIGAGIFETPVLVAGIAGSPTPMLIAWVLGGALSFIGALTYAELATTYPSAGGDYTFLTRAYGKNVSFLFAWARSTVICTGSIALLGFILGDYLTRLLPLGPHSSALYAAGAALLLTVINLVGLKGSSRMQNALAIVEIGGVIAVALAAFTLGDAAPPAIVDEGASTTSIEFRFGTDLSAALDDVRDAMTRVRQDLPLDANEPIVSRVTTAGGAIVTWSEASDNMTDTELSWFVDLTVTRELSSVPGVGRVTRVGVVSL
jgi:amino acid transporter